MFKRVFEKMRRQPGKTFGEALGEETEGKTLVEGKQTWEHVEDSKHDIVKMIKCCNAEIAAFEATGLAPAPYFFQRVAILARKKKNYKLEIEYCEKYIELIRKWRSNPDSESHAAADKGPTYKAICGRLPKARILYEKQQVT